MEKMLLIKKIWVSFQYFMDIRKKQRGGCEDAY